MPKTIKLPDFLNSRWVELAKRSDSVKWVRKEFPGWVERVKDSELAKRGRQLWDHFNSGNVSGTEKVLVIAALLYLISPVDLVPDWIPVAGLIDDAAVAGLVLDYVLSRVGGTKRSKRTRPAGPILRAVKRVIKKK
jgi:uncharacterized membrane protein YkvA (DUF1232 family)